jgi:ribonuclease P protein component
LATAQSAVSSPPGLSPMLPKRLRLPRAGFIAQKAGKRRISSHFSLSVAPALPKKAGIAVVISAKTASKAVDRHRLKRRAATILRPFASPTLAIALQARTGATALPFAKLKEELLELAAASGLQTR